MKKINLIDSENNKVQVYLVRFFKYNGANYFIYTLQEQDADGYEKLYLVKVMEEFGKFLSYHISDNDEWRRTQPILKTLLREIKYSKTKTFQDLDSNLLDGMRIEKTRVFKLDRNFVDILSDEKTMIASTSTVTPATLQYNHAPTAIQERSDVLPQQSKQDTFVQTSTVDYEKKYNDANKEIDRLNEIMGELLAENIRYKSKYGDLDD